MESSPDLQTLEKGDTMKGLVTVTVITLLWGTLAVAGPLEFFAGAGPSAATLGSINDGIDTVNNIIRDLNDDPRYEGSVLELPHLGSGLFYNAGERYWITDRLALGGMLTYYKATTATNGAYDVVGVTETSDVSIDLKAQSVGLLATGKFVFLDVGLRLAADVSVGYYYSGFHTAITFEMPSTYDPISIELPSGQGHYNGSSFGIEGGICLSFPIADWINVGTSVLYRSLTVQQLTDSEARGFDFDGKRHSRGG